MERRNLMTRSERQFSSENWDDRLGRPPLVPLGLPEHGLLPNIRYDYVPEPPQPQRVFFSRSDYSDGMQHDKEDSDKFELMNVTVVIYSLSGVMCEKQLEPRRRSTFGRKEKTVRSRDAEDSYGRISGSTISSFEPSASEEGTLMDNVGAPTTAVVSYRKNAFSSQTSLETFLPSVPMQNPLSSIGAKYRYQASWPSEQSTLTRDESAVARSSFKLTRCMKQETFVPGAGVGSNYVHETLELRINLSRGTELLRLGTATLVISGEEEGEVQMIIPAKPIEVKKKLSRKRVKGKPNKYGFFSGDLTRRFFLDENSTLRVGIRVLPQETLAIVEDKERKENSFRQNSFRQMLGSEELKQMVANIGQRNVHHEEARRTFYNNDQGFEGENLPEDEEEVEQKNIFQNIFCGALCATNSTRVAKVPSVPIVIRASEHGQLGLESLISSVSESTDGTEYDSDDDEAEISDYRMPSAFRHFA